MRKTFAAGYGMASLRADAMAGLVVGIVALPLSMALAIAVGAPPQHGLYTAIVAGAVVAIAGGSKFQVTGPTAAFVVILAPIVARHGLTGLLIAGLMAGVLLVAMGLARLGRLIQFIPHPVTTGFTAGIATVIATLQIKDVFALPVAHMPDSYIARLGALWSARGGASWPDLAVAAATLALLVFLPRVVPSVTRRVPAPLIAIAGVAALATAVHRFDHGFVVATIGSRFHGSINGHAFTGIPRVAPTPALPWSTTGLSFELVRELAPAAFAIAMLGAIESLLSAVIADGMTGKKHDPDAELVALGIGNIVVPFFGGIAATGALARTATNVRAGARSPFAAVFHSLFVLFAVLLFAPLVAYVPMASLAGLLLLVSWNMSEVSHFVHIVRVAPKSDVFVLLTCFALTVVFDMVTAVGVGVVLAALLFMQRMAELTQSRVFESDLPETDRHLPPGVVVYEVAGPLFFGAAQRAMEAFETAGTNARVVVLALGLVPTIDATGLVALESAIARLSKKRVVIAGPLPEPRKLFDPANLPARHAHVVLAKTLDDAVVLAGALAETPPPGAP